MATVRLILFIKLAIGCVIVCGLWTGSACAQSSSPHREGLDLQHFRACFSKTELGVQAKEKFVRKRVRTFDKAALTDGLVDYAPVPQGLRGAIRRVTIADGRKLIALTLDMCEQNGEIAGYDGAILDFLREQNVKATIFAGGKWMRSHASRTIQMIADPLFEMANHAQAHRNLRGLSGARLKAEVLGPQKAYEELRGKLATNSCVSKIPGALNAIPQRLGLFRFPYGACNPRSMQAVNDAGLLAIQWDVSTGDPSPSASANVISRAIVRGVKPGSIVIAHANGRGVHTSKGLRKAIPKLKQMGYEFVTVSELLAAGKPEIVSTCYNNRPGDTNQYDRFFAKRKRP